MPRWMILLLILIATSLIWNYFKPNRRRVSIDETQTNQKHQYLQTLQKLQKEREHLQKREKEQNVADLVKYHDQLYHLYYEGISDKYDERGNKIAGIAPDPVKAISHLVMAFKMSHNWYYLMQLALINHHGMHQFDPKLDYARGYYESIIKLCPVEELRKEAQDHLEEVLEEERDNYAYQWLNLPSKHRQERDNFRNSRASRNQREHHYDITEDDYHTAIVVLNGINHEPAFNTESPRYNDSQNVHNPQVLSTISQSLEKLKTETPIHISREQTVKEVRDYIRQFPHSDKKKDALKSLETIISNNKPITFCNITDSDALTLVWNRLHNKEVHKDPEEVKQLLFDELASMQEHSATVCSTGRLTRIVDTLNVVDPLVEIKPTYIINEEMMSKAAKIREELLAQQPDRTALEEGTSPRQDDFQRELQNHIKSTLHKDYVETHILTDTKFQDSVNKWITDI